MEQTITKKTFAENNIYRTFLRFDLKTKVKAVTAEQMWNINGAVYINIRLGVNIRMHILQKY